MAIDPKSIMLASTAGVMPSKNDVTTNADIKSVSDSKISSVCLATGSAVCISSGDVFTVPSDTALVSLKTSLKLQCFTAFSYTYLRLFYSTGVLRVWVTETPQP